MKLNSILTLLGILASFASFSPAEAKEFEVITNLEKGKPIPRDYYGNAFGCSEKGLSPALEWKNAPADTKSFAITVHDEDAPTGSGFWHYVLFNIPTTVTKVEAGDLSSGKIPAGSVESITDAGKPGYFGPCPPIPRKHAYLFTVYALKTDDLGVPVSSTPGFVGFNLWANTLAKASFIVTAGPRKKE